MTLHERLKSLAAEARGSPLSRPEGGCFFWFSDLSETCHAPQPLVRFAVCPESLVWDYLEVHHINEYQFYHRADSGGFGGALRAGGSRSKGKDSGPFVPGQAEKLVTVHGRQGSASDAGLQGAVSTPKAGAVADQVAGAVGAAAAAAAKKRKRVGKKGNDHDDDAAQRKPRSGKEAKETKESKKRAEKQQAKDKIQEREPGAQGEEGEEG